MTSSRATNLTPEDADDLGRMTIGTRDFASEAEERMPLPERLAEQIAMAIQIGQMPAGQRVREQDLSAMFGVSRGPIREALRILEGEGFVDLEPYRGAVVTRASDHEVAVAVEMQIALFGVAARTVAEAASDAEIGELAALIDMLAGLETDPYSTPEQFVATSLSITWMLIHLANSANLSKSIRAQRRLTRPDRWVFAMTTKAKQRKAVRQWASILEAIRVRNPGRAEMLAKARVRQIHKSTSASD